MGEFLMGNWEVIGLLVLLGLGIVACAICRTSPGVFRALTRKRYQNNHGTALQGCISLWPESWLAIKSRNLLAVQTALSLHNPKPCSWLEGFSSADKLFIAPPVKGWILVTGRGLPEPSEDVDACFRFILDLSRKLGQVQFFSANRASHHHAWVKAQNGQIERAYAWAGVTLWLQGSSTRAETQLALNWLDYGESSPENASEPQEMMAVNVEKVPLLAACWGLDPASVQEHFPLNEHGIAGKAAQRY